MKWPLRTAVRGRVSMARVAKATRLSMSPSTELIRNDIE